MTPHDLFDAGQPMNRTFFSHPVRHNPQFQAALPAVSDRTGSARVAIRSGARRVAENPARVPIPVSAPSRQALADQLSRPFLEMSAWPGAVPCARHHARQVLWHAGAKELIEPVELVVSEMVTNAIHACGTRNDADGTVRLWLVVMEAAVLVMVWDASPTRPDLQAPELDAESGRGLVLVDALSASWGSFELSGEPGKVVWALCTT
jgi:anti-sigma regulatory factor (Ser/Thr protein kinase)